MNEPLTDMNFPTIVNHFCGSCQSLYYPEDGISCHCYGYANDNCYLADEIKAAQRAKDLFGEDIELPEDAGYDWQEKRQEFLRKGGFDVN